MSLCLHSTNISHSEKSGEGLICSCLSCSQIPEFTKTFIVTTFYLLALLLSLRLLVWLYEHSNSVLHYSFNKETTISLTLAMHLFSWSFTTHQPNSTTHFTSRHLSLSLNLSCFLYVGECIPCLWELEALPILPDILQTSHPFTNSKVITCGEWQSYIAHLFSGFYHFFLVFC